MVLERLAGQQYAAAGNGYAAEHEESEMEEHAGSVAMGRQLSLRELFGKQREVDAGFAVKHHESPRVADAQPLMSSIMQQQPVESAMQPQPQVPEKAPMPMFSNNPDTDFFRSGPRFTPQQNATPPAPLAAPAAPPMEGENPLLALLKGKG